MRIFIITGLQVKTKKDFGRLVISVKENMPLYIGDDIVLVLKKDHSNQIKVLIIAPKNLKIIR